MTWYFSNLARYKQERESIETFAASCDWLSIIEWRVDDKNRLILDADISVGVRPFPITLRYPDMFPDLPPSVFPRGDKTRWSDHQFGAGGELCTEHGPDNWTPDLFGLDLLKSTYKLLSTQNPASGMPGLVASRHIETVGSGIRNLHYRFLTTQAFASLLAEIPDKTVQEATMIGMQHAKGMVHVIRSVVRSDGTTWTDDSIPQTLADEGQKTACLVYRLPSASAFPATKDLAAFKSDCAASGLTFDGDPEILLVRDSEVQHFITWEKHNGVYPMAVIPAQELHQRLDPAHESLRLRSVAIVGCGSLGSKVATSLARSGVSKFVLVDDDLLLQDNFVRNDLDWRDVGSHKTDALKRRLDLVNPNADVTVWRQRLGGQMANASAETMSNLIGSCDLIVDATADPNVLGLMSAIARAKKKPVLWAEVFGGGIGGLIARCRPGIEPAPQYMRRAVENWFGDQGGELPARSRRRYETGETGPPLIADDADVSAIAAHAARFALDILLQRDPSLFPASVYAIGLGKGSVFNEPFHTFPIEMPSSPEEIKGELSPDETKDEVQKLFELFAARTK